MLRAVNGRLIYNIQTAMDDNNGEPKERDATNEVTTESPTVLGSREQQAGAGHSDGSGDKPTYKQHIAKWFRKHFGGHRMLEWLTFAFEVLTFAALCIYSYFSYGQWQAMRDQIYVMTLGVGQTQHMLDQTAMQTRAAQQSAIAAQDAIAQSRNQFIRDQRPYLMFGKVQLEDEKGEIKVGQIIQYKVEFWNYGKSPALKVKGMAIVLFGQGSEETADKWFEGLPGPPPLHIKHGSVSIVPPGGDWNHPPYTAAVSPVAPNAEAMNFIGTHDPAIYIIGRSYYDDMAGNHYFTD